MQLEDVAEILVGLVIVIFKSKEFSSIDRSVKKETSH